jgi:YVTN family beta-propeller protein
MAAVMVGLFAAVAATAGPSNSLMDISPDGKRLALANTDVGTVSIVDRTTRKKLAEIAVGDAPEGVCWVANGAKLLVTVYGEHGVKIIDPISSKVVGVIKTAHEPYGIVAEPNGPFAYVSHDYPGLVSEIDLASMAVVRTVPAGPMTRGIALAPDAKTLYTTEFYTGTVHAISVATGQVIDTWPGYETDNLSRQISVHPKYPKAYLAHLRSRTSVFNARGSIEPELTIVETGVADQSQKRRTGIALDTFNGVYVMANPWESAISPDGESIAVVYAGSNDASVIKLLPEYPNVKRIAMPVTVGRHPQAVRYSPDGQEIYIANTLDHTVTVWSNDLKSKKAVIDVATPAKSAEWRRGKELFVTSLQPMGGTKWISCSTCHPDGLSDGRVWQNPEGPRRTPHLFGLARTHPLHWSADRDEVQDFEYTIRGKLMQGRGLVRGSLKDKELDELLTGRSADLDAMALYTNSFEARLSPHIPAPGKLSESATRGKALFFNEKTKCATCHSGPDYSDSTLAKPYKLHDVGTGGGENEKLGPGFDTPTLIGVYRTGPYLHDGRAKTLHDVLTMNPGDKHGTTSHLSAAERDDLVAFLKSLPFEPRHTK